MDRSCPTQRGPLGRRCQAALHGWRSPCAEQGGSGISAGRMPWSRREEEKKRLCGCQAPLLHTASRRTTSHLPLSCRSTRRGKEGEKEKGREPCLPAAASIPLFFQREQSARVPRWQGSRCLGANCALFVCRARRPFLAAGWGRGEVSSGDPTATPCHGEEGRWPTLAHCPCWSRAGSHAPAAPQLCALSHVYRSQQAPLPL